MILNPIIDVLIAIISGAILIMLLKASSLRNHWSYWEKFMSSKEFIPSPWSFEYSPENKVRAKKFLRVAGVFLLFLILLIAVRVLTSS